MARLLLIGIAVLSLAFAPAPLPRRPAARMDDTARIQGVWVLTHVDSQSLDGREHDRWVFGARQIEVRSAGSSYSWEYAIDPRASPRVLDMHFTHRGGQRYGLKGVYSLTAGELVLTYKGGGEAERPKQVGARDGAITLRFRREGR